MSLKLNVLLRFFLMTFLLITTSFIVNIIEAQTEEIKLPELFPTEEEWEHRKENPRLNFETSKDPLVVIFRDSFVASPDSCEDGLKELSPAERFHMKKSWAENQDKVFLVHDDTRKITLIKQKLVEYRKSLGSLGDEWRGILTRVDSAIELLLRNENTIRLLLTPIRYVEFFSGNKGPRKVMIHLLAKIMLKYNKNTISMDEAVKITSKLNGDVAGRIFKKTLTITGNSLINELESMIPNLDLSYDDTYPHQFKRLLHQWWRGALSTVHFLNVNGFTDGTTVQSFFQSITKNPKMVKELVSSIQHNARNQFVEMPVLHGSPHWTKHWSWNRLHRGFQGPSEYEDLINAYVLLDLRHHRFLEDLKFQEGRYYGLKLRFSDAFQSDGYSKFLEAMGSALSYQKIRDDLSTQAFLKLQVNLMIDLLKIEVTDAFDLELAYHLVYMLDLIEGCLFACEVNKIDRREPKDEELDRKLMLLRLGAKLKDQILQGEEFISHCEFKRPTVSLDDHENAYNILNEARDTYDQFRGVTSESKRQGKFTNLVTLLEAQHDKSVYQKMFFSRQLLVQPVSKRQKYAP